MNRPKEKTLSDSLKSLGPRELQERLEVSALAVGSLAGQDIFEPDPDICCLSTKCLDRLGIRPDDAPDEGWDLR